MKKLLIGFLVIVLISLAGYYYYHFYNDSVTPLDNGGHSVTIPVAGMTSDVAVSRITNTLMALPGMTSCVVDMDKKDVICNFDPSKLNKRMILETIDSLGYKIRSSKSKGRLNVIDYKMEFNY